MKGAVMTNYADRVIRDHGMAFWNQLLASCGIDGSYTSGGTYDDAELTRLMTAESTVTGCPVAHLQQHFGHFALGAFAESSPAFFDCDDVFAFLQSVDSVIHVEVRKLQPDAILPVFTHEVLTRDTMIMHYQSERQLCDFAIGLIEESGRMFGTPLVVTHTRCMHDGADHCTFRIDRSGEVEANG